MSEQDTSYHEEPFLQQEIILAVAIAVGILLMAVVELPGMLLVMIGVISVAGINIYRIFSTHFRKEEALKCCFSWFNHGAMVLAAAGILMLMLMNAFHRPVFITGLTILGMGLLFNGVFYRSDIKGVLHISAQLRLLIAAVLLVVFFLL